MDRPGPAVQRGVSGAAGGAICWGDGVTDVSYARSGSVNIAYQVTGGGEFDLVLVSGFVSHLDNDWEHAVLGAPDRAARARSRG